MDSSFKLESIWKLLDIFRQWSLGGAEVWHKARFVVWCEWSLYNGLPMKFYANFRIFCTIYWYANEPIYTLNRDVYWFTICYKDYFFKVWYSIQCIFLISKTTLPTTASAYQNQPSSNMKPLYKHYRKW